MSKSKSYRAKYYRTQQARRKGPRKAPARPIRVRAKQHTLAPHEYRAYMASTAWARRKAAYFQMHGRFCIVCGTTLGIHLHHLTYERLGRELDDDMRSMCEKHHAAVHEHHRLFGGTLHEATLRFIRRMHET